jgi:hypothetical protein
MNDRFQDPKHRTGRETADLTFFAGARLFVRQTVDLDGDCEPVAADINAQI